MYAFHFERVRSNGVIVVRVRFVCAHLGKGNVSLDGRLLLLVEEHCVSGQLAVASLFRGRFPLDRHNFGRLEVVSDVDGRPSWRSFRG